MARKPPLHIPRHVQALGIGALRAEIERRERHLRVLMRRREAILDELDLIDSKIRQAGPASAPPPRNSQSLIDALRSVLAGKTMTVGAACVAVREAGYHTSAEHFRVMVNAALLKKKFFKRVGRGMYTAV